MKSWIYDQSHLQIHKRSWCDQWFHVSASPQQNCMTQNPSSFGWHLNCDVFCFVWFLVSMFEALITHLSAHSWWAPGLQMSHSQPESIISIFLLRICIDFLHQSQQLAALRILRCKALIPSVSWPDVSAKLCSRLMKKDLKEVEKKLLRHLSLHYTLAANKARLCLWILWFQVSER